MKKLQNNFTTPEQSKRLLELGFPADSADCYHNRIAEKPYILSMPYSYSNWSDKDNPPLPCWSVGRLIEIWNICANLMPGMDLEFSPSSNSYIEDLIRDFELAEEDSLIYFSKLEE